MTVKQTKTSTVKKVVKPKTVLEPKENLTETIKPINDDALTDKNKVVSSFDKGSELSDNSVTTTFKVNDGGEVEIVGVSPTNQPKEDVDDRNCNGDVNGENNVVITDYIVGDVEKPLNIQINESLLNPMTNKTSDEKEYNGVIIRVDENDKKLTDILGEIRNTLDIKSSLTDIKDGEEILGKLSEIETELLTLKEDLKKEKDKTPPQIVNSWNGTTFI